VNKKVTVLLSASFVNAVVGGWVSIWFVKYFVTLTSERAFSASNILQGIASIALLAGVLGTKLEVPRVRFIVWYNFVSYLGLFGLYLSIDGFLIVTGVNGAILGSFLNMFTNSLTAQNVEQKDRHKFDNRRTFVSEVGYVIGVGVSFLFLPKTLSLFTVWVAVFVLSDISLLFKVVSIKLGILDYK
jgi:hypothetical protein